MFTTQAPDPTCFHTGRAAPPYRDHRFARPAKAPAATETWPQGAGPPSRRLPIRAPPGGALAAGAPRRTPMAAAPANLKCAMVWAQSRSTRHVTASAAMAGRSATSEDSLTCLHPSVLGCSNAGVLHGGNVQERAKARTCPMKAVAVDASSSKRRHAPLSLPFPSTTSNIMDWCELHPALTRTWSSCRHGRPAIATKSSSSAARPCSSSRWRALRCGSSPRSPLTASSSIPSCRKVRAVSALQLVARHTCTPHRQPWRGQNPSVSGEPCWPTIVHGKQIGMRLDQEATKPGVQRVGQTRSGSETARKKQRKDDNYTCSRPKRM